MVNYYLLVSELVLSTVWCFMFKTFTSSVPMPPSDPMVLFMEEYLIIIAKNNYRKVHFLINNAAYIV